MKTKKEIIKEAWLPCKGYEIFYEVSNFGNIRSLRRGFNLKPTIGKYGYCKVSLTGIDTYKTVNVHRLIAETFIPNPENKPQVNHIDGYKTNNNVENLEWATREENMKHAHVSGLLRLPKGDKHVFFNIKSELHPRARSIINSETLEIYGSIKDCAKEIKIKESTLRGWLLEPRINNTKLMYLDDYKNNNSWIRIESEADLPNHTIEYYVLINGSLQKAYYRGNNRWIIPDNDYPKTTEKHKITHWQHITKPLLPIY